MLFEFNENQRVKSMQKKSCNPSKRLTLSDCLEPFFSSYFVAVRLQIKLLIMELNVGQRFPLLKIKAVILQLMILSQRLHFRAHVKSLKKLCALWCS